MTSAPRFAGLILLAVLAGALDERAWAQGPPPGMPPPPVRVAEARLTSLAPTVPVSGSVVSRDDARLAAEADGRLVALAEIGTTVAEGEVVAQVDQSLLLELRAQFEAEIARVEAQIAFLERETERLARLAAGDNAAERELDDVRSQLAVARGDLAVARARLAQNRVALERTELRAPFDGQVTERFVNPGERVATGDLVARVVGRDRLEVVARATIRNVRFMYEGAMVAIRDVTGREGTGVVRTIVPFGDSTQHMYELRIDVDPEEWLVAQAVELQVPIAAPEEVLAVPRDAIVLRRDDVYVMRIDANGRAEKVPVGLGLSDDALIAVTGDIAPGDRVVVRGAERLMPGQQVRVLPPAGEQAEPAAEVSATGNE